MTHVQRTLLAHLSQPCVCDTHEKCAKYAVSALCAEKMCVQQVSVCTLSVTHTVVATSCVRNPSGDWLSLVASTAMFRRPDWEIGIAFSHKGNFQISICTSLGHCSIQLPSPLKLNWNRLSKNISMISMATFGTITKSHSHRAACRKCSPALESVKMQSYGLASTMTV